MLTLKSTGILGERLLPEDRYFISSSIEETSETITGQEKKKNLLAAMYLTRLLLYSQMQKYFCYEH